MHELAGHSCHSVENACKTGPTSAAAGKNQSQTVSDGVHLCFCSLLMSYSQRILENRTHGTASLHAAVTSTPAARPPQPPTEPPKMAPKGIESPKVKMAHGTPHRPPTQPPASPPSDPQPALILNTHMLRHAKAGVHGSANEGNRCSLRLGAHPEAPHPIGEAAQSKLHHIGLRDTSRMLHGGRRRISASTLQRASRPLRAPFAAKRGSYDII